MCETLVDCFGFFELLPSDACLRNALASRQINQVQLATNGGAVDLLLNEFDDEDSVASGAPVVLVCLGNNATLLSHH